MSWRSQWALALIASCGILLCLLGFGLVRGPTLDASVFMTIARIIASGGAPYLDAWDHKPPGIYLVEALASFVLPFGDWTRAWVISAAASVGTLVIAGVTLAGRVSSAVAFTVALITGALLLGCHLAALGGGYSEPLALFPATVALVLGTRSDTSRRDAVLAGIGSGAAAMISLQLAPAVAAIFIVLGVADRRVSRAMAYGLGAIVVPLAVLGWLAASGALVATWDALVVYNRVYVQNREAPGLDTLLRLLPAVLIASPLIAGSLARCAIIASRRAPSRLEFASALWIGIWVIYVAAQGDFFAHYAIAIAAPLMILGGLGLGGVTASARRPSAAMVDAIILASLVVPVVLAVRSEPGPIASRQVRDAAMAVNMSTGSDARLFVWGNEPLLYIDSDREPASRFVYLRPLTTVGFSDAAQAAALLEEWVNRPPDVIVDASIHPGGVQAYPLLRPWSFGGPPLPDALDPLRDFVRSHYVESARVGDWIVYLPSTAP